MRNATLVVAILTLGVLGGGGMARAQDAKPTITLDTSQLPSMPLRVQREERNRSVLMGTGAGAAVGILAADLITGGLLLAPLGIPAVGTWLGGGVAIAAPTYSLAQRVFAGVATLAAGIGGGYLGGLVARRDLTLTVGK